MRMLIVLTALVLLAACSNLDPYATLNPGIHVVGETIGIGGDGAAASN